MPRKRTSRIYVRERGGVARHYGDFRDFADVGGGQEALVAPGERVATSDTETAQALADVRLRQLQNLRRQRDRLGLHPQADLAFAADQALRAKALAESVSYSWLETSEIMVGRAVEFFQQAQPAGPREKGDGRKLVPGPRNLATIGPRDVRAYLEWLRAYPNRRGGTLSQQSVRHHLSALSNVYSWAISEGHVPMGSNPVAALLDKPSVPQSKTPLREPQELALVLEAARLYDARAEAINGGRPPLECVHPLIAFFLYTGAREDEVRSMDVRDVHFTGHMGPWLEIRGTKTDAAYAVRIVPLHPHLAEILQPYVRGLHRIAGPLFTTTSGKPFGDWTSVLDRVAARAGFAPGEIRTRQFRTAYATHRCTCDAVDANMVRLELGHADLNMMAKTYAKAQRSSERMGAEMSYRFERWEHRLTDAQVRRLQTAEERVRSTAGFDARAPVIRAFLAAIEGMSAIAAEAASSVNDTVIVRLRNGTQRDVRGKSFERMTAYLDRQQATGT
jgi:integrase